LKGTGIQILSQRPVTWLKRFVVFLISSRQSPG
jgi:hypothetical protein